MSELSKTSKESGQTASPQDLLAGLKAVSPEIAESTAADLRDNLKHRMEEIIRVNRDAYPILNIITELGKVEEGQKTYLTCTVGSDEKKFTIVFKEEVTNSSVLAWLTKEIAAGKKAPLNVAWKFSFNHDCTEIVKAEPARLYRNIRQVAKPQAISSYIKELKFEVTRQTLYHRDGDLADVSYFCMGDNPDYIDRSGWPPREEPDLDDTCDGTNYDSPCE